MKLTTAVAVTVYRSPFFSFGGDMSDYRALYRKWRPTHFDDVSGQDAITDILKYEVANNKLSHAYLFCGSRGTGKTTCAKILAKAVNCLDPRSGNPCNECSACRSIDAGTATDVIEMDAASNNGVDNVRDMKDEIAFTPAELKYRVYIIDEVHMMSSSAFNALLKTLEEPPSYVIFILATTEFHKLPTTIVSRCQRFDFRRIASDNIISRLQRISESEGISLTEDGARIIARVSRGGMRDAVSLLELCSGSGKTIDSALVFETVGSGNRDSVYKLVEAIISRDYSAVYSAVAEVVINSGDLSVFWQELIDAYRDIMVVKNTPRAKDYLDLTELEYTSLSELASKLTASTLAYHVSLLEGALADMQRAFNSKRAIAEIALTRMCDARSSQSPEALAARVDEMERELALIKLGVAPAGAAATVPNAPAVETKTETKTQNTDVKAEQNDKTQPAKQSPAAASAPVKYAGWDAVVKRISELKPSLFVQFSSSSATVDPAGGYVISMNAFFAKSLAEDERDLSIVRGVIAERERTTPDKIKLTIVAQGRPSGNSTQSELIRTLENELKDN